jgi:molecular chaperone GrpE
MMMTMSSMPSSTVPDVDHSQSNPGPHAARDAASASAQSQPTTAGGASGQPDQINAQEAQDRWRRTAADLENTRKRAARELSHAREQERAAVAAQFLPVLDNLELALTHAEADPNSIIDGVRAVLDQAVGVLARLGYDRRDESGVRFDPAAHEVVTVVDDPDATPGTVVRVLRPGYGDAERQLRPVGVAVARPRE